jgi:hypothetical protein
MAVANIWPDDASAPVLAPPAPTSAVPTFEIVTPGASLITGYIEYASERTDAPPVAHELMAVAMLSALAPRPRIPLANAIGGFRLVLWALYIVNSSEGRKTTVLELMKDILRAVLGSEALLEWEGSPQGFIQRLQARDGVSAVFTRDEYSGLLQQMNRGGHMAGMEQTLIRAYDGGVLENVRTRKKDRETGAMQADTDRVENPYLVTLSATTRDSFLSRATIDNVLDGFLARFIFVTGTATPRRIGAETPEMVAARNHLVTHAIAFRDYAAGIERVLPSDAVLDAMWALEQGWGKLAKASRRPDAAGPALKRLAESVLKTAALLAIDRSRVAGRSSVDIEVEDFTAARKMGQRWLASTLAVIEDLGATGFQRDCDAVTATVRHAADGISQSALYRRHRQLRKRDFDEILQALETQDVIRRVTPERDALGRPPVMFYAC